MHLIIQIPCYNEALTLPAVIADLPRRLPGIDCIEYLVIDDGSSDATAEVARSLGVHHVVRHPTNRGIAAAFQTGLDACLERGADIIVNTDGDHQYPGGEIQKLLGPILDDSADMVVGDRQTHAIEHFSLLKKLLQSWGSWVVRVASGTDVPDATSGFRALNREAALRLIILTRYSYTLETLIQAGKKGLRVAAVPIEVNPPTRESRLVRSIWSYVRRQALTILRIYTLYEPLRSFALFASPVLAAGVLLLVRFLYLYLTDQTYMGRHVQSVVVGSMLVTVGFLIILFGVLADVNATNRYLLEQLIYKQRKQQLQEQRERRSHGETVHESRGPARSEGAL
jgi:glycosyltransferase involved in cell wall biosynthesis